jgi:hypothetical protein
MVHVTSFGCFVACMVALPFIDCSSQFHYMFKMHMLQQRCHLCFTGDDFTYIYIYIVFFLCTKCSTIVMIISSALFCCDCFVLLATDSGIHGAKLCATRRD